MCGSVAEIDAGHRLDLAARAGPWSRRDAPVRHVDDFGAGARIQELEREMVDAAGAGGAVVELARLTLRASAMNSRIVVGRDFGFTTNTSGLAAIGATGTNCLIGS